MMGNEQPWALGTELRVGGVGDPTRLFHYIQLGYR